MNYRVLSAIVACLTACASAPPPPTATLAPEAARSAPPAEADAEPLAAGAPELEPLVAPRERAGEAPGDRRFLAAEGAPASTPAAAPLPSATTPAPAPWSALLGEGFTALGQQRGIKVYRRDKLPGVELAAEGTVEAPPEQVRRVLLDYPSHTRWQKHLKENKVLARGDGFLEVYQRLTLPILDDRDFSLRVTWGSEGSVLWMRFTTKNEGGPAPVPGVVRVTKHHGSWRLEPASGGKATSAVYRCYIDLAGSFPSWMGKDQATNDLPALFENIRRELPRYR